MPLVFICLSVLYFIYVLSQGNTKMIGDEIGGDPGSMMLPAIMAFCMFATSAYLFITDKPNENKQEKISKEEKHLYMLTLVLACAYVVLIRPLGFIPSTSMLLFTLCYANLERDVRKDDALRFLTGNLLTLAMTLVLYTIGRKITRTLLIQSRKGLIPQFWGKNGVIVFIVFAVVTLIITIIAILCKKKWHEDDRNHSYWLSIMMGFATTEYLYIIFKQLFLVELVKGVITW